MGIKNPLDEKTVILIKPDGVQRGLVGEVISRFEKTGLKIIGLKICSPGRDHVKNHYPNSKEWLTSLGKKSLSDYVKYNIDPISRLGTKDPLKIGKMVAEWLYDYMCTGPVVAIVFQGNQAVGLGRKIVGATIPIFADAGTIRGDFSKDSPILANLQKRGVKNLVHASGSLEEAEFEINHWFTKKELLKYRRADESVMFA